MRVWRKISRCLAGVFFTFLTEISHFRHWREYVGVATGSEEWSRDSLQSDALGHLQHGTPIHQYRVSELLIILSHSEDQFLHQILSGQ